MRPLRGQEIGRKRPRVRAAVFLLPACLALHSAACNTGDPEQTLGTVIGGTPNARFMPTADPACARTDLLSMQPGPSSGSVLNVDLVLTDCDASLTVSGVSFEISFNGNVLDFIGCSAGTFFPTSSLAPGTPICTITAPGNLLGSIAMATPVGISVPSPGTASVVRLAFSINQQGVSSPAAFVGTDILTSTSVFLINPSGGNIVVHALGGAGYEGGTFISN